MKYDCKEVTKLVIVSFEVLYSTLYFHFDVIAFDHDFVTWNALLRWRPQNSPGFQVEIRTRAMDR